MSGKTILTLEMPADAVEVFKKMYLLKSPKLMNVLKELGVVSVEFDIETVTDHEFHSRPVNEVWALLGDVPVNDNGEIEIPFMGFPVGTDREDIWHKIEEVFDVSVASLMGLDKPSDQGGE